MVTKEELDLYQALRTQWRADPVLYARTRLGINPTRQQQALLEAVAPFGSRVTCRAGHGVGKTTAISIAVWWHLECFDFSKTPCTAPTASQLYQVLWSEIAKTARRAEDQANKLALGPEFRLESMFRVVQDRVYDQGKPNEWFAVARTSRKEKPDALQGFHASDLIITNDDRAVELSDSGGSIFYVIEEASGVPDEIIEVIEGALSSHRARLIMVGNPTRNSGFFSRSHKEDQASFKTLHFRCADSPLAAPDYREQLERKYGVGSNVVRVRADGEFPKQEDDVLISIEYTEAALMRDAPPNDGSDLIMGVDVARYGDDRTTIVLRRGPAVLAIYVYAKQGTMETVGCVTALFDSLEVKPRRIKVDVIGVGAGVVDRLKELEYPVDGVNVAETATLPPILRTRSSSKTPEARFQRQDALPKTLRDYVWQAAAAWLQDDEPSFASIADELNRKELAAELSSVHYKIDSAGKLVIEPKDEMKKRGLRSPDLAEGLLMTFAPDDTRSIWERLG